MDSPPAHPPAVGVQFLKALAPSSLDWNGTSWERGEFADRARDLCRSLQAWLPEPDSGDPPVRLGILAGEHAEHLLAMVAVLIGGWTQALVPSYCTSTERLKLRQRYGLTHLLTDRPGEVGWADHTALGEPLPGWQLLKLASFGPADPHSLPPGSLVLSLSSGTSSGQGTLNSTTLNDLLWTFQGVDWSPYRLLQQPLLGTGMQFANGRMAKLSHLLQGHHLVVRNFRNPFLAEHFEAGATACTLEPSVLRTHLRLGHLHRCPAEFLCLVGSDHVPMDLRRAVADLGRPRVGVVYATSSTGPLTWLPPEELLDEPESLGRPLANVTLDPLGDEPTLVRNGLEFREMAIRKTWHIRPVDQPDAPPVPIKVVENFNPNDLLAASASGQIIFAGRANDVFLFRSLLVSPMEVEQLLRQQPEVLDCAGFGAPSPHYGAVPLAAVVLRPGADPLETAERLRRLGRDHLGLRSPKKIVVMSDLPRGPTGKPLRRVLASEHAL